MDENVSHVMCWKCVHLRRLLAAPVGLRLGVRGVRNPMNMSDIGFLKNEPNWPENSKTENSVTAVRFSKNTTSAVCGRFSRFPFTIRLPTWKDQQLKYINVTHGGTTYDSNTALALRASRGKNSGSKNAAAETEETHPATLLQLFTC